MVVKNATTKIIMVFGNINDYKRYAHTVDEWKEGCERYQFVINVYLERIESEAYEAFKEDLGEVKYMEIFGQTYYRRLDILKTQNIRDVMQKKIESSSSYRDWKDTFYWISDVKEKLENAQEEFLALMERYVKDYLKKIKLGLNSYTYENIVPDFPVEIDDSILPIP